MADIRRVTDTFSVAPQLDPEDFATLKAMGFAHLINNRPDGESGDQVPTAEAERLAKAAGLTYVFAPFVGQPTQEAVEAAMQAMESTGGATLAYCRSGTRSINAWAIAAAAARRLSPDEIIEKGATAGYNLAGLKDLLRNLASR
jgi:uncharacterized protein (TIGR01244 family)